MVGENSSALRQHKICFTYRIMTKLGTALPWNYNTNYCLYDFSMVLPYLKNIQKT